MVLPIKVCCPSTRKVGYSLPFIRPPVEIYGPLPLTHIDGGELWFAKRFGHITNTMIGNISDISTRPEGSRVHSEVRCRFVLESITHLKSDGAADSRRPAWRGAS